MRVSLFHFMTWGVVPMRASAPTGGSVVDDYLEQLRVARDDGFELVWTPQLWREPDLMTVLAHVLPQVDGLSVGTGVIPIQTRHPATLAQQALAITMITGGRLKLGIGMTHEMISSAMYGIPWDRHVRRLNEYLDGLLPLLNGQEAKAVGELTTTCTALDIQGAVPPPVYVAALGPMLLEIAGRRTEGTVTWMTGPRTLANHVLPTIRRAAEAQGRTAEVIAGFPVAVTDSPAAARAIAADALAIYGGLPSYRAMLDRENVAGPADMLIAGDEAAVKEQLEALAALGIDECAAYLVATSAEDDRRTRTLLGSLARTRVNA